MNVPAVVQQVVRARARALCEYCHLPEWVCAARFTLDHLLPRSLGGSTRRSAPEQGLGRRSAATLG